MLGWALLISGGSHLALSLLKDQRSGAPTANPRNKGSWQLQGDISRSLWSAKILEIGKCQEKPFCAQLQDSIPIAKGFTLAPPCIPQVSEMTSSQKFPLSLKARLRSLASLGPLVVKLTSPWDPTGDQRLPGTGQEAGVPTAFV